MKQYWPCAKYRDDNGEIKLLFTYDSLLTPEKAMAVIVVNWKGYYKFDIVEAWIDVFENGEKIEVIKWNPIETTSDESPWHLNPAE